MENKKLRLNKSKENISSSLVITCDEYTYSNILYNYGGVLVAAMGKRSGQIQGEYDARIKGHYNGMIQDAVFEGVLEGAFEGRAEMDTEMSRGEKINGQRTFNSEDVKGEIAEGNFRGQLDGVIRGALKGEFEGEMAPR